MKGTSNPNLKDSEEPTENELFWRQYFLHFDIYKFHMEAAVKFATLLFTVTGATIGFYIGPLEGSSMKIWFLIPTLVMNIIFALGYFIAGRRVPARKKEVLKIAQRFKFEAPPDLALL